MESTPVLSCTIPYMAGPLIHYWVAWYITDTLPDTLLNIKRKCTDTREAPKHIYLVIAREIQGDIIYRYLIIWLHLGLEVW